MADDLIPIPIPALVAVLLNKEREKGEPLTEDEVIEIRDSATCQMGTIHQVRALEESRGYSDIDPEKAWEQWQVIRLQFDS
ncbi:hypothetical protein O5O45_10875 [Hahella aquimaris]|uniref:hypothetical protein n=1 Tax=Hahella sp. HNIBRBA332 TaxID=3015983 RepID=UPI00273B2940|nr:hypothetical protein [Hahella sp. HNIBRBA332]WLQ16422.1 hypothetical protein O5O45_10875 [Hahella sp. HNIBRBA332]